MAAELKSEWRYDSIKMSGLSPFRRDSDGAMLFEGVVTRESILEYRMADGSIRREWVTPQAVLDTARTMPRSVVTLNHPPQGMVTPETYQQDSVGDVDGEAFVEEDAQGSFVRVRLAVRRADAIQAIEDGVEELSAGYIAAMDYTPGTHATLGRYDAAQVGRDCNHAAIVPRGRAGETVGLLRADSADAAAVISIPEPTPKDSPMNKGLILLLSALGVERMDSEDTALADGLRAARKLRVDAEEVATAAEKEKMAEDASEELAQLKKDNEALKAELDELKAAEEKRADAAALADLQSVAAAIKLDGADEISSAGPLRLAIVQSRVPSARADWPVARLEGMIDIIRADAADIKHEAVGPEVKPFGAPLESVRADSAAPDPFFIPSLDGGAQ